MSVTASHMMKASDGGFLGSYFSATLNTLLFTSVLAACLVSCLSSLPFEMQSETVLTL